VSRFFEYCAMRATLPTCVLSSSLLLSIVCYNFNIIFSILYLSMCLLNR
jgi:hypothetical protein